VAEELLPGLAQWIALRKTPGCHGTLGASMGGLSALWLGVRLPRVFGRVFSQAGAFGMGGRTELIEKELIRLAPPGAGGRRPLRVYLDVGTYDFLYEGVGAMRRTLEALGYPVAYHELHAGHNYPAWREDLARGLAWLFPPDGR
jgi:enterochelin esterase family protein